LVKAYNASNFVFYGTISKTVPEPNFKPGALAVYTADISQEPLPTHPVVWAKSKEFTFSVEEYFKQPTPQEFTAYLPDPDPEMWVYVENAAGDLFLARPQAASPVFGDLFSGERGLFFLRYYLGSSIAIVYKARLGDSAKEDLKLLRAHQRQPQLPLEAIYRQELARQQAEVEREAKEFKVFEDEYYKILRIQDLDIRTSLLQGLVERMGYKGRWNYFDYKERYLKRHGAHISDSDVPSSPSDGKEKLWHDISGELEKIEVIQKARAQ
jgi:hypothetical protein